MDRCILFRIDVTTETSSTVRSPAMPPVAAGRQSPRPRNAHLSRYRSQPGSPHCFLSTLVESPIRYCPAVHFGPGTHPRSTSQVPAPDIRTGSRRMAQNRAAADLDKGGFTMGSPPARARHAARPVTRLNSVLELYVTSSAAGVHHPAGTSRRGRVPPWPTKRHGRAPQPVVTSLGNSCAARTRPWESALRWRFAAQVPRRCSCRAHRMSCAGLPPRCG